MTRTISRPERHFADTRLTSTLVAIANTAQKPTKPNKRGSHSVAPEEKLPIKMLNDRILVEIPTDEGERRSTGGILIQATAQVSRRLAWAVVKAVGPNVRNMEIG
ncbi:MAG: co-chaperone GroES, partial [Acidimicrobiales bacterium]